MKYYILNTLHNILLGTEFKSFKRLCKSPEPEILLSLIDKFLNYIITASSNFTNKYLNEVSWITGTSCFEPNN
ncbi:hypothetical protein PRUPE_7G149900 [Prunus persica]|uniref:Uncharacterized protein n=1 Tax=Prunus persica TaxID=3760 RepID=M5VRU8_PRUPE|nr:hypothetical protein PRUPE_7G149900 [Prunus persica]